MGIEEGTLGVFSRARTLTDRFNRVNNLSVNLN